IGEYQGITIALKARKQIICQLLREHTCGHTIGKAQRADIFPSAFGDFSDAKTLNCPYRFAFAAVLECIPVTRVFPLIFIRYLGQYSCFVFICFRYTRYVIPIAIGRLVFLWSYVKVLFRIYTEYTSAFRASWNYKSSVERGLLELRPSGLYLSGKK